MRVGEPARKQCAVSIDMDSMACYYRIHALGAAPRELDELIMARCLPRFVEMFERRGIPATFFVVGQDADPACLGGAARATQQRLRGLVAAGHEIGNHSFSHPYDLARLAAHETRQEIQSAHALLSDVIGSNVVGFRAPGYDLSATMLDELMRLGYLYDSSIFPAPGYYVAKAAVMGAMAITGRPSGAVLTNPRALLAPTDPYRPAATAPWRRGQASVVELPVSVTPGLRIPAIGTSLLLAPDWLRARLLESMRARDFFNLELHGIDLADADVDGIPGELVAKQPDLRVPLQRKERALEATLDRLAAEYDFATLRDVAINTQRSV